MRPFQNLLCPLTVRREKRRKAVLRQDDLEQPPGIGVILHHQYLKHPLVRLSCFFAFSFIVSDKHEFFVN